MMCKHCGEPIAKCQLGALVPPGQVCYFHIRHSWHRCDGKPLDASDAPVAEPAEAAATP